MKTPKIRKINPIHKVLVIHALGQDGWEVHPSYPKGKIYFWDPEDGIGRTVTIFPMRWRHIVTVTIGSVELQHKIPVLPFQNRDYKAAFKMMKETL